MSKGFKLIAVADPHMSNRLPYARPSENDRTDRLDDQLGIWKQIKKVAKKEDVDGVLVLGDLFDKSLVDAVTLTHTVSAIVNLKQNVYILPGNHDANSVRGGRFTVEAFGAMDVPRIQVIGEKPGHRLEAVVGKGYSRGTWLLHPVAFKPAEEMMKEIRAIQEKLEDDDKQFNALFIHGSVIGAHHLAWQCDEGLDPDAICEGFDIVLAGHFHEHQTFGDCGMYLGAPMHHHFGDAGRLAGFWIIEFGPKGRVDKKFIPSNAPSFHALGSLKAEIESVKPRDYLRYILEATHAKWAKVKPKAQAHCEALKSKGIRADFKHKPIYHHEARLTKTAGTVFSGLSMESAIVEYIKSSGVKTADLDGKRLKKMGLEALAKARTVHGVD